MVGLGLVALGMFLVSGWDLDVGDPELTMHLMVGGLVSVWWLLRLLCML